MGEAGRGGPPGASTQRLVDRPTLDL
jgi:hypothetical protein